MKEPPNTDFKKTYSWRYVASISKKFIEWELDEDLCKRFLRLALSKSSTMKLRAKGLAILHQSNILQETYDELVKDIRHYDQQLEIFKKSHEWLNKFAADGDKYKALIKRQSIASLPAMVQWYQAQKLSAPYIAYSVQCSKAYVHLAANKSYKSMLPSPSDLYKLRYELPKHQQQDFKQILQKDWREPCKVF